MMIKQSGHLVVVGSMNMDLSVQVKDIPKPGETILGSRVQQSPGGKGSNQAVAAAKLGARVSLIAMVGEDVFGNELINAAHENGVDTSYVQTQSREKTGIAFITVSDAGENAIVVAPGANAEITPELAEVSALQIGKYDAMSSCLEIPIETIQAAFKAAKKTGAITLLNASPYSPKCLQLIEHTDYLIVNEHEIKELSGIGIDNLDLLTEKLASIGVSKIVITLGAKGALYLDLAKPLAEVIKLPAPAIKPIDTTGCGDAFAGAFAAELSRKVEISSALETAIKAGSFAATKYGAQPSYGTRAEIAAI